MATITSNAGGTWSTGATWVGGVSPVSTDDVVIVSGHDITVSANATCASLTNGGSANACIISIDNGVTLTVTGNVSLPGNSIIKASGTGTATLKFGGTFQMSAGTSSSYLGAVNSSSTLNLEFISVSGGIIRVGMDGGF